MMIAAPPTRDRDDHATRNRLVLRNFLEHPTYGWRHIGIRRATAVYRGENSIEEFASQTIRVVSASLVMKDGHPQSAVRLHLQHWKFDERGYVDQKAATAELGWMLNATLEEREAVLATLSESDVNTIKQLFSRTVK